MAILCTKNITSSDEQNLHVTHEMELPLIRAVLAMSRKSIEKFISISIAHLDKMDGDPDFEQDNADEWNGDEGDYTYSEWRATG